MSLHDLSSNDRCNVEIFAFNYLEKKMQLRARSYNTKMLKRKQHRYQLVFEPGKGRVWTFVQKKIKFNMVK